MAWNREHPLAQGDTTHQAALKIRDELGAIYEKLNKCRILFFGQSSELDDAPDGALLLQGTAPNYQLMVKIDGTWRQAQLWRAGFDLPSPDTVEDGTPFVLLGEHPAFYIKLLGEWVKDFGFNAIVTPAPYSVPLSDESIGETANLDYTWFARFQPYDLSQYSQNEPLEMGIGDRAILSIAAPDAAGHELPIKLATGQLYKGFCRNVYGIKVTGNTAFNPGHNQYTMGRLMIGSYSNGLTLSFRGLTPDRDNAGHRFKTANYAFDFDNVLGSVIPGHEAWPMYIMLERVC